jgi:hypothetical protein
MTLAALLKGLNGPIGVALLLLVCGAIAIALDWLVRWARRNGASTELCRLLHIATLAIAAIDLVGLVAFSADDGIDAAKRHHAHHEQTVDERNL